MTLWQEKIPGGERGIETGLCGLKLHFIIDGLTTPSASLHSGQAYGAVGLYDWLACTRNYRI